MSITTASANVALCITVHDDAGTMHQLGLAG